MSDRKWELGLDLEILYVLFANPFPFCRKLFSAFRGGGLMDMNESILFVFCFEQRNKKMSSLVFEHRKLRACCAPLCARSRPAPAGSHDRLHWCLAWRGGVDYTLVSVALDVGAGGVFVAAAALVCCFVSASAAAGCVWKLTLICSKCLKAVTSFTELL